MVVKNIKMNINRAKILGVPIDLVSLEEAGKITENLINKSHKSCKIVTAPNVEIIMRAQKDEEFFSILNLSELATPDSIGVTIGIKKQGKQLKERIPGQAYFRKVFELAEEKKWTIYILGGKEDVIKNACKKLQIKYPNSNIIGYHNGYFDEQEERKIIEQINLLEPNVLFVALGAPKQEKWIAKNKEKLKVDIACTQGGTLDYESGNIKRAPKVIQKIGIEWLWRLILQPKRIIRMRVLPIYLFKIIFSKNCEKGSFDKKTL